MTDPAGPVAAARPVSRSRPAELSRRGLLGAGLAVFGAVAGGAGGVALTAPRRRAVPDPVLPADIVTAVAREQELIAGYDAVSGKLAVPDPRLIGIRDEHQSHLEALSALLPASTRPSRGATGSPTDSPNSAQPAAVTTVADLQAAEAAAATAARDACLAGNGTAAVLLACVAASEASHAAVLA